MKASRILQNNNMLYSETTSDAWYPKQSSDFSMRLVFSGNENYSLGGRQLNVYPGSFLVLNEGTNYSRKINSDVPVSTFSVFYSPAFLRDFHNSAIGNDVKLLDDPFSGAGDTPHFLETLYPFSGDLKFNMLHLKKHFDAAQNNEMLINEYMNHSLMLYYKIYDQEVIAKSSSLSFLNNQTRVEILRRLAIAKDYILSNYAEEVTLDAISRQACLSVNHLLRTFKQAFKCSPHQYLIQVRLNRAKYLLRNTNYSVNEVVGMIGFECASSFIRLFKNSFNETPGSFRNKGLVN